jgi:hypothetical protein
MNESYETCRKTELLPSLNSRTNTKSIGVVRSNEVQSLTLVAIQTRLQFVGSLYISLLATHYSETPLVLPEIANAEAKQSPCSGLTQQP